jgi:regulator of protease activity HflC (stomatin/prohibitin superfamily)
MEMSWLRTTENIAIIALSMMLLYFTIRASVRFVYQWDRAVIFRFGNYSRLGGPGLTFKWPWVEDFYSFVDLRTRTSSLKAEETLTRDAVAVTVETICFWRVMDAQKAALSVYGYENAVEQVASVCLREAIGAALLNSLLSDRTAIDAHLRDAIAARVTPWGIEVQSVDLKDISIPDDLQDAMSRQAQAERERDARITLAEAEMLIATKMVTAAATYDASPNALRLRQMGLIYEMGQNGTTILIPTEMTESLSGGFIGGKLQRGSE